MFSKVFISVITISILAFTFVTIIQLMFFLSSFSYKIYVNNSSTYSDVAEDEVTTATISSVIDVGLLIGFIIQHSLFSSPLTKLTTYFNIQYMQRIIFNLLTSVTLQLIIFCWQPIPNYVLWNLKLEENSVLKLMFVCLHALSWFSCYIMSISFDITEILGIKWVYYHLVNTTNVHSSQGQSSQSVFNYSNKSESMKNLQKKMKHPGFICLTIIFWVYPIMRLDRLFMAVIWTVYMALSWDLDDNDYNYIIEQRHKKFAS